MEELEQLVRTTNVNGLIEYCMKNGKFIEYKNIPYAKLVTYVVVVGNYMYIIQFASSREDEKIETYRVINRVQIYGGL